jgi:hypothetical protein
MPEYPEVDAGDEDTGWEKLAIKYLTGRMAVV